VRLVAPTVGAPVRKAFYVSREQNVSGAPTVGLTSLQCIGGGTKIIIDIRPPILQLYRKEVSGQGIFWL
jgi:hypothetical protein